MTRRLFAWLMDHRSVPLALVVGLTLLLGGAARKVHPDFSVENLFPVWDSARKVYDRFKRHFPFEDARAHVMVQADDLFSPAGLTRIGRLEAALRQLPDVFDVVGPLSAKDIVGTDDGVAVEPLFPRADLPPAELARRKQIATHDPIFRWNLAKPDGSTVTIEVTLTREAAQSDGGRQRFLENAEALLAREAHPGQKLVLSGIPAIRAKFARLIASDVNRLLPAALFAVLLLLWFSYRSLGGVVASLLTMIASIVWSQGLMGLCGYSITILSSIMPIVIVIISLSDTVHIVNDYSAERRAGHGVRDALVGALGETAIPCLLTEIVLACGFLSLVAVNIVAVYQFGIATAAAMLLTWLANMTVLPLALSVFARRVPGKRAGGERAEAPWAVRTFARAVDWIGVQVTEHKRRVVVTALVILAVGGLLALRVKKISYVFDDLRPHSQLARELRFAEAAHGGVVPVALYLEAEDGQAVDPVLDPTLVRVVDRGAALLRSFPEIAQANSVADYLRKSHRLLAGEVKGDGLPTSAALTAQELTVFDDGKMLRSYLSSDHHALAAVGYAADAGSVRVAAMFQKIDAWAKSEQAAIDRHFGAGKFRLTSTGQLRIFKDVNDSLLTGLVGSFAGAILISFLVFCVVLRSWRLGLIGLIPNVSPIVLVLAFMALAGINLKPGTVILFSITLVIADDDTIQYLARFRTHYQRARAQARTTPGLDLYKEASLACLREVGLPMFVTSTSVSLGFLILVFSRFIGTADVGFLIGATLFAAIFADLFLNPILIMWFRPELKVGDEDDQSQTSSIAAGSSK